MNGKFQPIIKFDLTLYLFFQKKLNSLQSKKSQICKKILLLILDELTSLQLIGESFIIQKIPVTFEIDELKHYYNDLLNNNSEIKKIDWKISAIQNKITCLLVNNFQEIKEIDLYQAMNECEDLCIDDIGYSPSSKFDEVLAKYVPSKIVEGIAKKLTYGDFEPFNMYFENLCKQFFFETKYQKIVLKCALSRLIFTKFYEMSPILDVSSNQMQFNILKMMDCSPKDLNFDKHFFHDPYFELPLKEFYRNHKDLAGVSTLFDSLNYLIDPFDIIENVWKITMVTKGVLKKVLNGKLINFDDYFTTFIFMFCENQPLNAKGIALFLKTCESLNFSASFIHASATFIGAVDYIEHFHDHCP